MNSKKSKEEPEIKSFEKDYNKIMEGYHQSNPLIIPNKEWAQPGDFIVKFSLYQETPNSITSTETSVNF